MSDLTPAALTPAARLRYTNILERAPDAGGLAYWSGLLDSGKATTAQVLDAISDSPENIAAVAPLIANGFEYVPYG